VAGHGPADDGHAPEDARLVHDAQAEPVSLDALVVPVPPGHHAVGQGQFHRHDAKPRSRHAATPADFLLPTGPPTDIVKIAVG
jgi:hypothetical protein